MYICIHYLAFPLMVICVFLGSVSFLQLSVKSVSVREVVYLLLQSKVPSRVKTKELIYLTSYTSLEF